MVVAAAFLALDTIHQIVLIAWPAPFFIFIAGALDVFDGEVARRTGKEGPSGAFFDSTIDRLSDVVLIFGMAYSGLINYYIAFLIAFLCIMISYIRSRAENEGVEMRGVGWMERAERILILFGALILETWLYFLSGIITFFLTGTASPWIFSFPWIASRMITPFFLIFILIFIFLLLITVIQRISHTFKELGKMEEENQKVLFR